MVKRSNSDVAQLKRNFEELGSIESFLELRDALPQEPICAARFAGLDPLFAMQTELEEAGIAPLLVCGVLDGDEREMDKLTLQLMAMLVERRQNEKAGKTHIQSRRQGVADSLVDYLIMTMLEACERYKVAPPASLVILIRDRLGGPSPARHQQYLLKEKKNSAIWRAAQMFSADDKISIRKLAKELGVEPSTISRWFAKGELERDAQQVREMLESDRNGTLISDLVRSINDKLEKS